MKQETVERKEREKEERESKARLLANPDFHRFLPYFVNAIGQVEGAAWLSSWIVTGCEIYFTDVDGEVKRILHQAESLQC